MTPDITTLSDAQLSEVFAVECAGCTFAPMFAEYGPDDKHVWFDDEGNWITDSDGTLCAPWFASSADAVMPFLVKSVVGQLHSIRIEVLLNGHFYVRLPGNQAVFAPTFARAACIALILAARSAKGRS